MILKKTDSQVLDEPGALLLIKLYAACEEQDEQSLLQYTFLWPLFPGLGNWILYNTVRYPRTNIFNPRRTCAVRVTGLSLSVCVCENESVTSLTATPLTYRHKGRYKSKANAVLKVFDSWISLKILCSKVICSPQRTLTILTAG